MLHLHRETFGFVPYADSAHKLLCDSRDRYIEQSKQTRNGVVAPLPPRSLPAARPAPARVSQAGTNNHAPAGGRQEIDPFAREYEREQMEQGRANQYDARGFLID